MKRVLVLLCLLSLLGGCRTTSGSRALGGGDSRPRELLEQLRERGEARRALRARAQLLIDAPDLSFNRPQRMAISRPARLRVEILGLFSQIAAVLVTDGKTYQVYDVREAAFEEGPVTDSLLWEVARVDLEPGEAARVLLGVPEPASSLRPAHARVLRGGAIAFDLLDSAGRVRERYLFDAGGRLLETERIDGDGHLLWRVKFDEYRSIPDSSGAMRGFAYEVELEFPRVRAMVKLTFKEVALVSHLPDELFHLSEGTPTSPAAEGFEH